ncbi:TetR/AcrR family transcriptional regulator [Subtercola endophyticus]|uniref:TetR/AcrR family transcriptional regulator n=1 Tax=Subtercola endophyticus TaxID=2895559 RepID=UPI001E3E1727|nr:TetR/AcrR family transcriptional regulator [Subtercola endophyticus]UFS58296.1 TetR/AcrR family transcriptional regulator [Subtercola endophyticus]
MVTAPAAPASGERAVDDLAPAPPSLRERKKRETRLAIHESALRLVAENGVEGASVDAICSEAGVSGRTFFNYYPSKFAAIVGIGAVQISDAQRAEFLRGAGEKNLMRDLCRLMAQLSESSGDLAGESRDNARADRQTLRELLTRRPELVPGLFTMMLDLRHQFIELATLRTSPDRARFATSLLMAALICSLDTPLDPRVDNLEHWLFDAVHTMQGIDNS